MPHTLPDLPYAFDALEPFIDAETMRIHHDKHHGTYVANLNKALEGGAYADWPIERLIRELGSLPEALKTPVRNNGGGHLNHSLFWTLLTPPSATGPQGSLARALDRDLGGPEAFKAEFSKAALGRFGSGWAWLVLGPGAKLAIQSTPNQDNPLSEGLIPILGLDVWEHAYYLKYQNRRADYVDAFFNVLDWKTAGRRYEEAMDRP